jgi:hypothetical protein
MPPIRCDAAGRIGAEKACEAIDGVNASRGGQTSIQPFVRGEAGKVSEEIPCIPMSPRPHPSFP